MNKEIKVFNGENLPAKKDLGPGQNMMQVRSQYVAAMIVPVPRNEEAIIAKIEKVARYVGHDFFYLWPVSAKNEKKVEMVSGGTIDLAETILYYWTNVAIEHDVEDLGDKWKIKHVFIDFERGIQWPRTTIVYKPKETPGGWDKDRWERMKLNTAFSYNLRDLVFTVIPRWMKKKIINVAKEAELEKATEELKKGETINFFIQIKKEYGISEQEMLDFIGEKELNSDSYFKIKNIYAQLARGDVKASKIGQKKVENRSAPKQIDKPKKNQPANKAPLGGKFMQIVKSFEIRNILESEICAYYGVDDLVEMDTEEGLKSLQKMATDIEGEKISVMEFKKKAAERFEMRQKDGK